jgi:quinol monooxygenase YgiN
MVALVVTFDLRPGTKASFLRLLSTTVKRIRATEPDTLLYVGHEVPGHATHLILYELYRSQRAFEYHEDQPHIKRFLTRRQQYLRCDPLVQILNPVRQCAKTTERSLLNEEPSDTRK